MQIKMNRANKLVTPTTIILRTSKKLLIGGSDMKTSRKVKQEWPTVWQSLKSNSTRQIYGSLTQKRVWIIQNYFLSPDLLTEMPNVLAGHATNSEKTGRVNKLTYTQNTGNKMMTTAKREQIQNQDIKQEKVQKDVLRINKAAQRTNIYSIATIRKLRSILLTKSSSCC